MIETLLMFVEVRREELHSEVLPFSSKEKAQAELELLFAETKHRYNIIFDDNKLNIHKADDEFLISAKGWFPRHTTHVYLHTVRKEEVK